jgi:hypothetical protein
MRLGDGRLTVALTAPRFSGWPARFEINVTKSSHKDYVIIVWTDEVEIKELAANLQKLLNDLEGPK